MNLFITLLENVNKSRTSANNVSLIFMVTFTFVSTCALGGTNGTYRCRILAQRELVSAGEVFPVPATRNKIKVQLPKIKLL
jgi:hypothetical protein